MDKPDREIDSDFFQRRLAQEQEAAGNATDDRVRESHRRMAERYRGVCDESDSEPKP